MQRQLVDLLIERLAWVRRDLAEDNTPGDVDRSLARMRVITQAVTDLQRLVDRLIDAEVLRARDRGASFTQIGDALGITRQSAHQRWLSAVARTGRSGVQTALPRRISDLKTNRPRPDDPDGGDDSSV